MKKVLKKRNQAKDVMLFSMPWWGQCKNCKKCTCSRGQVTSQSGTQGATSVAMVK